MSADSELPQLTPPKTGLAGQLDNWSTVFYVLAALGGLDFAVLGFQAGTAAATDYEELSMGVAWTYWLTGVGVVLTLCWMAAVSEAASALLSQAGAGSSSSAPPGKS